MKQETAIRIHFKFLRFLQVSSVLSLLIAPAQPAPSVNRAGQGERLFKFHCAGCHGPKGEGGQGPTLATPVLIRAPTPDLLIKVIKQGVPGTEMPESKLDAGELRQVAAWVRKLGQLPSVKVPGSPRRGEQLYLTRGNCSQCHAIKGRGGASGTDLTDIGLRRGPAYLRTALTDPGADVPKSFSAYRSDVNIAENFLQVRIVTKDGENIDGVRLNEDTFSIQVRDSSDRIYSFFKSELLELHKDWGKSPMPDYRDVFSKQELDDLVAFLVSLRGEK